MRRLSTLFLPLLLGGAGNPGGWSNWRGPYGNGMAESDAPLQWSDTEHIAWKVTVPGKGNSSPVLWGDRIFLTTAVPTETAPAASAEAASPPRPRQGAARGPRADGPAGGPRAQGGPGGPGGRRPGGGFRMSSGPLLEHKFVVLCYDRKTGKQLWAKVAKTAKPHEGHHNRYGSFASNSPVTDGKVLIASFGSRGVYAYALDGKPLWEKDFGVQMRISNSFGEGSWPALDGDKLLLSFDHEGDSFLVALDKNTGKQLWRTERPRGTAWSGPFVLTHNGRKQVILAASKNVAAYDLESGKQIWEATGLGSNVIPSPVAAGGMLYVMSGHREPNLMAIRLGKEGNLTGSDSIVWQNQRGNSYTPSPVLHDGKLYMLTDSGMLSCLDAKTGAPYYAQQRLPKPYNFKASPVGANGKLYLASEDGDVIVVKMGEKFEVLATNTLADQMFVSTPAIAGGEIFLRSQTTLFCVR